MDLNTAPLPVPETKTLIEPPAWRRYLVYLTVALMPLSFNVENLLGKKSKFFLSPLDALLPLLCLLLLADLAKKKPWARFQIPPLPVLLWVGICWLSVVWTAGFPGRETLSTWLGGLVNPVFFGFAAVWVFQNVSGSAQEYRRLLLILGGSFAVCTLLALRQYVGPQGLPFDPANPDQNVGGATNVRLGGWYAFRGIFGAHAAMLIPAAVAIAACERDAAIRAAAGAFAAVCFCVTLSAGGMLGALAGTLAVAGALFATRHGLKAVVVLLATVAVLLVVLPKLPRLNLAQLHRGTALYADNEKGDRLPTARLRRYQASHSLLAAPRDAQNEASAPKGLLGVGLNRYQKEINAFYRDPYPKPGRRTDDEAAYDMESDEPFTFGFLETATVETGVVGLLALLTLFGTWIAAAQGAFARVALKRGILADIDTRATLALASLGAGVGALVCSVFANPVIRGVGGTFAFFIALAYCAQKWADD